MEPLKGILFVRCAVCREPLPSVAVDHDDSCNGATSDGLCRIHEREMMEQINAMIGAPGGHA